MTDKAGQGAPLSAHPPHGAAERAKLEIANGLRQYDLGIEIIQHYLEPGRPFSLHPSLIRQLQKVACDGLEPHAGEFRRNKVGISGSRHTPPGQHLVPSLVQSCATT